MPPFGHEHFSLSETINSVWHAFVAVVCRIGFDVALHGLIIALVVLAVGLTLGAKGHKYGRPLVSVFRKLSIFCVILGAPGAICLYTSGTLPRVNSLELSSVGLLGFWSLVTLHLCMEEMNFQWFQNPEQSSNS